MILHCSISAVNAKVFNTLPRDSANSSSYWPPGCPCRVASTVYNVIMHIVVIAWLYVTVLMALTETSVVAGILSLIFYGLLPTALLLWLFGGPARRRRAARLSEQTKSRTGSAGDEARTP